MLSCQFRKNRTATKLIHTYLWNIECIHCGGGGGGVEQHGQTNDCDETLGEVHGGCCRLENCGC